MKIGFTGTREGMTQAQFDVVRDYILRHVPEKVHNGDCVGADADFHKICLEAGVRTKGHPPKNDEYRAFNEYDEMAPEKSYYARNRDIVNESEILIVCPKEMSVQPKGGTWYTYGYGKMQKTKIIIVWPDGSIKQVMGQYE